MFLMSCTVVDTVDAEQLILVLAIKSHEITVQEALLGDLVLIGHRIQVQACA